MKAKKYTLTEWRRASDWAQKFLGLEDWSIDLWTTTRPKWAKETGALGSATWNVRYKTAEIWINSPECATQNMHPFESLFHEYLHIAFADVRLDADNEQAEFLVTRLEVALLAAYHKKLTN